MYTPWQNIKKLGEPGTQTPSYKRFAEKLSELVGHTRVLYYYVIDRGDPLFRWPAGYAQALGHNLGEPDWQTRFKNHSPAKERVVMESVSWKTTRLGGLCD